jgi:hypothetical protein
MSFGTVRRDDCITPFMFQKQPFLLHAPSSGRRSVREFAEKIAFPLSCFRNSLFSHMHLQSEGSLTKTDHDTQIVSCLRTVLKLVLSTYYLVTKFRKLTIAQHHFPRRVLSR